ncbi:MAG: penicillin acylase family protein [Lysobacteraceae bacterium]
MRRTMRWVVRTGLGLVLVLGMAALAAGLWLRGSLPVLDGERTLAGLQGPVEVERDALGTVSIRASTRADAMRALGFVHAQERYFEMDLMRRSAAGELAALVGPRALPLDRRVRMHRMRSRAEGFLAGADPAERVLLDAYTDGVNAGLDALRSRPWAYGLLRARPEPWRAEDTLLVGYAMFFDLHDSHNRRELALLQARRHLPPELLALLASDGSAWDAPLMGDPRPELDAGALAALARVLPQAAEPPDADTRADDVREDPMPGSNNFAVAGRLTGDGRAIVADDMHLGLRAPNIWFRAHLGWADAGLPDGRVEVGGVSLPGLPGIVVGSNGHVAWGFTNAYGDWHDFVRVHWIDREALRYRTADGEGRARRVAERIAVAGGEAQTLEVIETRWGPVLAEEPDGSSLALAWTAHREGSLDLGLLALARARDLDQALDTANRAGLPPQNFVAGDRDGRIGWTIAGRLPLRVGGCDPLFPLDPVAAGCDWAGWLPPASVPRLADPADGRLWTANSRVADGEALRLIGDGGYDLGARQRQIRDALMAGERFDEQTLLDLQLDDRALFLEPWWRLVEPLARQADPQRHPALATLAPLLTRWEGHAATDAVAYRLVRGLRTELVERLVSPLLAPAREAEGEDWPGLRFNQAERLVWPLVSAQPADWPLPVDGDWIDLFEAAAAGLLEALGEERALDQRTWGERNTASIAHPLAAALPPALARRLSMPAQPLPGDSHMPRVQAPGFGASQRMVVAPGHEADGLLHMPGGQSGHPLSPFWAAGHDDWSRGSASPFLPGEARHRLRLLRP